MTLSNFHELEQAIRNGWGADTTTPEHRPDWTPDNPARDQCGVTALVVHDLLGGDLIRGEVHVDGERVDYHWWNRLGMGIEVDLTREQFAPEEMVVGGDVIERPAEIVRLREEYELLRSRVVTALCS
ncbi:YunG family protein [Streptomyces sp. NPDC001880]